MMSTQFLLKNRESTCTLIFPTIDNDVDHTRILNTHNGNFILCLKRYNIIYINF